MMLKIYLLGSFQLMHDQTPVSEAAWHTRQARQLLKLLLTERHKIVAGDRLIEALWSEADPDKAATTLRTAINALRKTLEPARPPYTPSSYIVAHAPGYKFEFTDEVWVDVVVFEGLLDQVPAANDPAHRQTLLTRAIALYRDDYLSDDPYADWAYLERERLRERYLTALVELAELQADRGDYERASASLRRVLARDPGREPVTRTLMRYYVQAGDTVAALRAFEQLRTYLSDELGADPSPQTSALHQSILNGQLASSRPVAITSPEDQSVLESIFVGRESEIGLLNDLLVRVKQGRGSMVALTGEVGVGKTRLASVLLDRAKQQFITLTARCQTIEQALPFAPLVEALESAIARRLDPFLSELPELYQMQLAQLLPSLAWQVDPVEGSAGLPEENRRLLVDSLVQALRHLAKAGLVLCLDDWQWADEATLAVISRLTRVLDETGLLILTAYRPEEVARNEPLGRLLHDLTRHRLLKQISLDRFSPQEVAAYLQKLTPQLDVCLPTTQAVVERLHRLTGGNPLFLAETLRALLDDQAGSLAPPNLDRLLDDPTLERPSSQVTDIILARLEQVPRPMRDVLDIAAVISRDFSVELLDAVASTDPLPALTYLLQRQFLIETSPGRLDFSHHLVREVIYLQLSPLTRQRLHQRVVQVLISRYGSQAGPRAAEIARHSRLAGLSHSLPAVKFAVLAGDYAMRTFGFQEASLHYRQALESGGDQAQTTELDNWLEQAYQGLGLAQESLADWDAARETYNQLQHWAQRRGKTRLGLLAQQRLATMLGLIGQLDESAAISARVIAHLPADAPPVIVDMQNRLSLLILPQDSQPWSESGWPAFQSQPGQVDRPWEAVAEILGERQALQVLNLYGWGLTLQGQTAVAEAILQYVIPLAGGHNQPGLQATGYHLLAQLWDLRGDYTHMERALAQALALVENEPHLRWSVIWGRIHRAYVDMRWNQLARAEQRLHQLNAELTNRRAFHSHWLSVQVGLGLVSTFQGNLPEAMRYFEQVWVNLKDLYASNYVVIYLSRARLNRMRGDLEASRQDIVQALLFAGKRGMLADYISAVVEAARYDRAVGQPLQTVPLLAEMETMAGQASLRPACLSVRQALIRAFTQAGQLDEAARYRRLAIADRDTIAASIPQSEDQAAYLARRDLRSLDE